MKRQRRILILALLATALVLVPASDAKEFSALAAVGSRGDSVTFRGPERVIDLLFAGTQRARPRGGYVRFYPLGADGFVGVPGRFYPATAAVCLGWDQSRPPRDCRRAHAPLVRMLQPALRLARFHTAPTTVRRLRSLRVSRSVLPNLKVVFELAFDRRRLSRAAGRPSRCVVFTVTWSGPDRRHRPSRSCLSPTGVYASGRLYPLGRGPWALAWANLER